jgi:opacity protein-like surface antigen
MWGAKLTYNYMNTSSTRENFLIPQFGDYDDVEFTGNAVVQSMEVSLSHQFALIPYLGREFERGFFYAGMGPTLSKVDTDVTNLIGFADVLGRPTDISGRPQDFSSSDWVFGGAAVIGGTFFVDESWFVDVNYTFARTMDYTADYKSTFVNPGPPLTFIGDLIGKAEGSFTSHTFAMSINRAF